MTNIEKNFLKFCEDIKNVLVPYKTNFEKIRIGDNGDGGYVICDVGTPRNILYSYGCDDNIKFEKSFKQKYENSTMFVYDHTIEGITDKPDYIKFFKEGVWVEKTHDMDTISNHVIKNGHENETNMCMQMDIEGCEWSVILATPQSVLRQFAQIIIEFHFPLVFVYNNEQHMKQEQNQVLDTLQWLDENFTCVHIHGNNCLLQPWFDIDLPRCFEVTYVRRDLITSCHVEDVQYPMELDSKNDSKKSEMVLKWWLK